MLLVSTNSCPLAPANSLLCITGKRGFCIIQPSSCASSLVPSGPARGIWQLQPDWEIPGLQIKAQVCENTCESNNSMHLTLDSVSSLCLWRGIEGKMHKSHPALLEVIYWNKAKAISDQEKITEYFIYWWHRKRKLTFWQCSQSFTLLSSCCLLFSLLDPYQPVQIQSSAQCPLSIKSSKKAECSWPVLTPHCTYLQMTIS